MAINTMLGAARRSARALKRLALHGRSRLVGAAAVFDDVYRRNVWGGAPGELYSGSGSQGAAADLYVAAIGRLLAERPGATVLDVGCGDFRIGARIAPLAGLYLGLDVSPTMVAANAERHCADRVRFLARDAAKDPLPEGDVCLIRQVLQHLSNREIAGVMARAFEACPIVVVTEHYPAPAFFVAANLDKPTGATIRIPDGSGVYLDEAPFALKISALLLDLPLPPEQTHAASARADDPATWERLKTFLLRREDQRTR